MTVTSVLGHVFERDFDEATGGDPVHLFGARTAKAVEGASQKHGIPGMLAAEAVGADYLFLWLDCDREGENICFEVLDILRSAGSTLAAPGGSKAPGSADYGCHVPDSCYRAKFSALNAEAIKRAWHRPARLDPAVSDSVDLRQELDLKVGCSFTRLLNRRLLAAARAAARDEALRVISP